MDACTAPAVAPRLYFTKIAFVRIAIVALSCVACVGRWNNLTSRNGIRLSACSGCMYIRLEGYPGLAGKYDGQGGWIS